MSDTEGRLIEAVRRCTGERIEHISTRAGGHINRSFLVTGRECYVLQRLNRKLYADDLEAVGTNYM